MSSTEDHQSTTAEEFSCGFLIMRNTQSGRQFLLMKHKDRWDLPKGHVDDGETNRQCALRELWEETGITVEQISIDEGFQFVHRYHITTKKGKTKLKELTIYLATLLDDHSEVEIKPTEHLGSQWFDWQPPHQIETKTIDGLLEAVAKHLAD